LRFERDRIVSIETDEDSAQQRANRKPRSRARRRNHQGLRGAAAGAIDLPLRIEFLGVQSYGDDTKSSGVVQITLDLTRPIEGEDVLIVEDIVDTGLTLAYLREQLFPRKPRSVKVCGPAAPEPGRDQGHRRGLSSRRRGWHDANSVDGPSVESPKKWHALGGHDGCCDESLSGANR
jgi:hypothetical protein